MMREEFINLTKVEVSGRYYTEAIEPQYMANNVDKQTFCADWLKINRNKICKAVTADFDSMNMDVAVMNCNKAEYKEAKSSAETLKNQLGLKERDLQEAIRRRDAAEKRENELEAKIWELQEENAGLRSEFDNLDEVQGGTERMLAEKDMEIMKLKAMLYDQMTKVA